MIRPYRIGKTLLSRLVKAAAKRLPWNSSMEHVFSRIFETNAWAGNESISGPGSEGVNSAAIKRELPGLLAELQIKTMLDAPCGDFHWMKDVPTNLERYIGADIVAKVIRRNQKLYGRRGREFTILDITKSRLPCVDLILCRDCLVHLSFKHIREAFNRFKESGATYLLTTTFLGPRENVDIETGEWRTLNLQKPPFMLPEPLSVISDEYLSEGGVYKDKKLGLWKLADIDIAAMAITK